MDHVASAPVPPPPVKMSEMTMLSVHVTPAVATVGASAFEPSVRVMPTNTPSPA